MSTNKVSEVLYSNIFVKILYFIRSEVIRDDNKPTAKTKMEFERDRLLVFSISENT